MNENSTKKNRPKSQIMMPNSTSPLPPHGRKNGSSDSLPNHRYENEWEVRSKELAEAKTRVAQMEKTMRWWSDCTDNWRKKWSEVKTERNELRKELRVTKNQMGKLMKSLSPRLQEEAMAIGASNPGSGIKSNGYPIYGNMTHAALAQSIPTSSKVPYHHGASSNTAQPFPMSRKTAQTQTTTLCSSQLSVIDKEIVSLLEEKVAHLTTKLDEVNRRLVMERDEKAHLHLTVERLRRDLSDLHELYESLKKELCDINGKEFTESEVESYAEEETEEARLLEQLAQDACDPEELEEDDFDPEKETEEVDKHTPIAETPAVEAQICSKDSKNGGQGAEEARSNEPLHEAGAEEPPNKESLSPSEVSTDCLYKQDLAASIQVEISEVHRKLDLKTFISDVTELVGGGGVSVAPVIDDPVALAGTTESPSSTGEKVPPEITAESMLDTLEVFLENQDGGTKPTASVVQNGDSGDGGDPTNPAPKLVPPDPSSPPPLPTKSPPNSSPEGHDDPEDGKKFPRGEAPIEIKTN